MPHKIRRAVGVAGLGLGLVFAMAPAASAESNGANVGGAAASIPVVVCGNAVNVIGLDATAHCEGTNGPTSAVGVLDAGHDAGDEAGIATPMRAIMMSGEQGNTSNGQLDAGDSNGVNVGGAAATVPVIVCGNAVNVIGLDATARCEGTNG